MQTLEDFVILYLCLLQAVEETGVEYCELALPRILILIESSDSLNQTIRHPDNSYILLSIKTKFVCHTPVMEAFINLEEPIDIHWNGSPSKRFDIISD